MLPLFHKKISRRTSLSIFRPIRSRWRMRIAVYTMRFLVAVCEISVYKSVRGSFDTANSSFTRKRFLISIFELSQSCSPSSRSLLELDGGFPVHRSSDDLPKFRNSSASLRSPVNREPLETRFMPSEAQKPQGRVHKICFNRARIRRSTIHSLDEGRYIYA